MRACLFGSIVMRVIVAAVASADTATLQLKRIEGDPNVRAPPSMVFRSTSSQLFLAYVDMPHYSHADGQWRSTRAARIHDHRPQRRSCPAGPLRIWLRFHLPVLVASTLRVGR
jgi:hypothetical protein